MQALISCVHYDIIASNKLRAIQKIKLFINLKYVVRHIFPDNQDILVLAVSCTLWCLIEDEYGEIENNQTQVNYQ